MNKELTKKLKRFEKEMGAEVNAREDDYLFPILEIHMGATGKNTLQIRSPAEISRGDWLIEILSEAIETIKYLDEIKKDKK